VAVVAPGKEREFIAAGGEAFASKSNAIRAIDTVRRNVAKSEGHKEIGEDALGRG